MKKPGKGKMFRPHTVNFKEVHHAVLSDTLYQHGPNHILELGCFNCEIDGVKVFNPPSTGDCEADSSCSHNTDAVDIHGQPFYIHDVNFTTGDDNIAGHANHSLVEDSYFGTGHGASIGSLCSSTPCTGACMACRASATACVVGWRSMGRHAVEHDTTITMCDCVGPCAHGQRCE